MKFIKIASVLLSFGAAFVNAAAEADPQDNAPKKFLRVPGTPYVESDAEAGCIKEWYDCRDAPCCGSMECIDVHGYHYCSHQSGGDAVKVPSIPYVESDAEAGCIKEFYGCRDAPCCGSMECIDSSQGYQYCSHQSGGDAVEVLSIPDVESDAEAGCIGKFQSCDDAPCCGSMDCFEFYAGEKKFCFPSSSGDAVEVPSIPDVESDAEAGCIGEFQSCADAPCCDSMVCFEFYAGEKKYCFRESSGDAVEVLSIPDVESDAEADCIGEFHSCADALCCDSLECIDSYGGEYKYCFRKSGGDAVEVPSIPDVESDSK